jgi:hypothetical protein
MTPAASLAELLGRYAFRRSTSASCRTMSPRYSPGPAWGLAPAARFFTDLQPPGGPLRQPRPRRATGSQKRCEVDQSLPAPLAVPPLAVRSADLDRIIADYAVDAIAELAALAASFTADDHVSASSHRRPRWWERRRP